MGVRAANNAASACSWSALMSSGMIKAGFDAHGRSKGARGSSDLR